LIPITANATAAVRVTLNTDLFTILTMTQGPASLR
jgi:hypothetical protein